MNILSEINLNFGIYNYFGYTNMRHLFLSGKQFYMLTLKKTIPFFMDFQNAESTLMYYFINQFLSHLYPFDFTIAAY